MGAFLSMTSRRAAAELVRIQRIRKAKQDAQDLIHDSIRYYEKTVILTDEHLWRKETPVTPTETELAELQKRVKKIKQMKTDFKKKAAKDPNFVESLAVLKVTKAIADLGNFKDKIDPDATIEISMNDTSDEDSASESFTKSDQGNLTAEEAEVSPKRHTPIYPPPVDAEDRVDGKSDEAVGSAEETALEEEGLWQYSYRTKMAEHCDSEDFNSEAKYSDFKRLGINLKKHAEYGIPTAEHPPWHLQDNKYQLYEEPEPEQQAEISMEGAINAGFDGMHRLPSTPFHKQRHLKRAVKKFKRREGQRFLNWVAWARASQDIVAKDIFAPMNPPPVSYNSATLSDEKDRLRSHTKDLFTFEDVQNFQQEYKKE